MQITMERLTATLATLWPDIRLPASLDMPSGQELALSRDSRDIATSPHPAVFIAVAGVHVDGRRFIDQALADGAELVLADAPSPFEVHHANRDRVLSLPGLNHALGELGRLLFEVPSGLELIGVTGTNGKSSVTHYIAALSETLGDPAGVIGTLGWGRAGQLIDSGQTTPGPLELQAALGSMAREGVKRVAAEVSSHALEQERLLGCRVTVAVFTNLSRDHLDYHASMAAYAAAKARLFKRRELKLAVVNGDDSLARLMLAGLPHGVRVLACGEQEATTFRVLDWQPHATGQRVLIATPDGERALEMALMGRFNLDNVLLAMAVLYGLGEDLDALCEAASGLSPVTGRMQRVSHPGAPTVVVDYAHTPDALGNALDALRAHLPGDRSAGEGAKLWCVFGCGGDRDSGKRPLMGEAAALADRLVITDDNPRGENPATIRQQILDGVPVAARDRVWCIEGRGNAIDKAIAEAEEDDVILIAGKGHETYQEIEGQRMPFSDQARAEAALDKRGGPA
ncbi:UDP-N-acetylmuramoylalanyl-D-glutamate--2,6-diaminopimelate ligase [Modicisalibacter ilicicola DSM 19980]|uniref:UDP-N-acetylmuramoyl-L-alanyl-D-glutamate--2,6-diaminopimelate ligase n=1 Tax=Modicisalibacter ilicicola DSM 19980 TaxID=1121942 RepID=A0A1M5C643_9GAMM|nr:UDP-N-acetylmuramoyl-L-alanyl-D-glutamate--2,6-diaminopimelate ligase [Halomonas ilicicola]SHF50171.1 UDP-N-acetylmuramoylalanyl-D-glutamate--2,6-diaminopimelate ligase [Halomonas ilicicola DSM 19980]